MFPTHPISSFSHFLYDRINQGLDDRNERLVFKRIVANSTAPPPSDDLTNHSGQYFLITPKLLPNLYDMENEGVTILFVFNGKHSFQSSSDWENYNKSFVDNVEEGDENAPRRKKRRSS